MRFYDSFYDGELCISVKTVTSSKEMLFFQ